LGDFLIENHPITQSPNHPMNTFPGFTSSETFTQLPDSFFHLLGEFDDLDELKVTLYVLWRFEHMEARTRYISQGQIAEDDGFARQMTAAGLAAGLEKAVRRGTLLRVERADGGLYLLNSPLGRAIAEGLQKDPGRAVGAASGPPRNRPNIFKLYEENIGPLTPLMADALKEAEKEYEAEWFGEAFTIAVTRSKRNWKYIEAILKRWKEEGHERKDQPDGGKGSERYTKNKFSEYLDHD
jgi:DnaD/phage-associated family protein